MFMFVDLNNITEKEIIINQEVIFNQKDYQKTSIKGLKNVFVKGKIYYSETGEVIFEGSVKGIMSLQDANDGTLIDYPFKSDINEIIMENEKIAPILRTNEQNSLDLKEVLWQNIVLEVPIRVSKTDRPKT